jgi:hypothetical protein
VGDDYLSLAARVFSLYEERRFDEALSVADDVRTRFPDRADRAYYWTACLRCLSGDSDAGLRSLQDGLRAGLWFAPDLLRSDGDLATLRGRSDFQLVVEESDRRWRHAQATSRLELQVFPPSGLPRGVFIALHGSNWRAEETAPTWEAAVGVGMLLAVPQSSQVAGVNGYDWSDRDITEHDLGEVYRRLRSHGARDGMPIVLGGFSQGAGVAVTLAIDGTGFPVHGFVAVAPAFSGIGRPQADPSEAARRGVRGVMFVGEHDPYRPEGEEVQRGLAASGVRCDLVVEPGIGHVIPPGFESRLETGVDIILRDGPRAKPSDVAL